MDFISISPEVLKNSFRTSPITFLIQTSQYSIHETNQITIFYGESLMLAVQNQTKLEAQSSSPILPIVEPTNESTGQDKLVSSALPGAPFATLWYFNLKSQGNAIRQLNLGGQVVGNGGVNRNSAVFATVTEVDFNGTLIGDANLSVNNIAPTDDGQIFIRLQNSFTVRPIDVVVKIMVIN